MSLRREDVEVKSDEMFEVWANPQFVFIVCDCGRVDQVRRNSGHKRFHRLSKDIKLLVQIWSEHNCYGKDLYDHPADD